MDNNKRNRIPRGYLPEDSQRRLDWLKNEHDFELKDLPGNDTEELKGIIENHVGFMKIPMAIVGPVTIDGKYAKGKFPIPLCTIEGTLAASMNRGLYASSLCGGMKVKHFRQELSRSPIFIFDDLKKSDEFQQWVTDHLDEIIKAGPKLVGKELYEISLDQKQHGGLSGEHCANLVCFLASSLSDGITGKLISAIWDDYYEFPKHLEELSETDIYTLRGEGVEIFTPKFNYKGFQFVEVLSNKPIELTKESPTGIFMHSDVPSVGRINSSNPLINKLWSATNNAYLSNLYGYPTDCPQREKNGWTGDAHIAIEMGLYNFDGITVYEKWLNDHRDEQQPNGVLPAIIPTSGWGYHWANGPDWTSSIAIIPWNIYLFYGDKKLLKDSYENIKRYVDLSLIHI